MLAQRTEGVRAIRRRVRIDIGLRQVGYLFLCRTENELAAVEIVNRTAEPPRRLVEMVTGRGEPRNSTLSSNHRFFSASFSPRDGYAQPRQVVHGYADAARGVGVVFSEQTEVTAIDTHDDSVMAVHTSRGPVRTDAVICAAGAWSQRIGEMAGVFLPVLPVRRQIGFTGPLMQPMPTVPFTLDLGSTLYFHNAGEGLLPESPMPARVPASGGSAPLSGWPPSMTPPPSLPRLW